MAVDELYWNSIDFGSDESLPRHVNKKHYVDPWDLENYAYIRQHLDSIDLSSDPSSDPLDSGNSASFYYIPGHAKKLIDSPPRFDSLTTDQGTSNYAAIDDIKPYRRDRKDDGYSSSNYRRSRVDKQFNSFDSETEESPYEEGNRDSSLLYIYETRARCRRIAMPSKSSSRDRSFSFSYGEHGYDPYGNKQEVYSKLDEVKSSRDSSIPIYDDIRTSSKKPNNFGLSNYGHLKIDYSYSWNNLDKYICN